MNSLNIISLNCFGIPIPFIHKKLRFEKIADKILEIKPDLVLLQEVWMRSEKKLLVKKLSGEYKIHPEKYRYFGPGGLVLLANRLEVGDYQFHKFKDPGPLSLITIPDILGGKGFQSFKIHLPDKDILIINAHLLCSYGRSRKLIKSIENQLSQIYDFAEKNNLPLVIAGDLNLLPNGPEILNFKGRLGLADSLSEKEVTIDLKN